MSLFPKSFLLFIGILASYSLQGQNLYEKVNIPVETTASSTWVVEKIRAHDPILDNSQSELFLQHEMHSLGGIHFTYIQTYKDIPIYNAGIKANLLPKTRISSLLSTLVDFSDQDLLPFSYSEELISQRLAETLAAYEIHIEPYLLLENDQLISIYKTEIQSYGEVSSWEILINATNGEEIQRIDNGAYFHKMDADTSGKARIFIPNPCTRLGVNYGDLFIDSMDKHKPLFDSIMDTVTLKDITYESGKFKLEGPHVKITDRTAFFIAPATSTDGNFYFSREESGFEDVMVYYHVDTFQRFIQNLGFTNLQNNPLTIDPHGKSDLDQSVFIENSGNPYILFGDGGVDDAEDADVIIHEYGHAISYAGSPGTNSGTERRGLDEGFGDYFAAIHSLMTNTNFGWDKIFNWDGHNEFWNGRTVKSTKTYPPTSTSIYTYGEIWAATLIKIREDIGETVTDRLVLQELYSNFSQMTIPDAARLLIDADTALNGGVNSEIISFYLCEAGILSGANCLNVGLESPIPFNSSLNIYPNPGNHQFVLEWNTAVPASKVSFSIVNMLGQEVYQIPHLQESKLPFSVTFPEGLYIGFLLIDGKKINAQKIVVK